MTQITESYIKRVKKVCLYGSILVTFISNLINYFYNYKYLNDSTSQWRLAMCSIALVMFLMSVYMWLAETLKQNKFRILITGWSALYLLFNFIGVAIGYNLHTKGFMAILFTITIAGSGHILIRLWQKYF